MIYDIRSVWYRRPAPFEFPEQFDEDGRYIFLELNPNGQWAWIEELTGLPISDTLIDLMFGR